MVIKTRHFYSHMGGARSNIDQNAPITNLSMKYELLTQNYSTAKKQLLIAQISLNSDFISNQNCMWKLLWKHFQCGCPLNSR